jgi:uncharacterized protein
VSPTTKQNLASLGVGLLFAAGLALSGMTLPSKVIGFFDFSRGLDSWDPSLALVMGGGMAVYLPIYRLVRGRKAPLFDDRFRLPNRKDIDVRLVGGAVLFGLGWGLGGFCPGPALTSVGALSSKAMIMAASMLVGMFLFQRFEKLLDQAKAKAAPKPAPQPETPSANQKMNAGAAT